MDKKEQARLRKQRQRDRERGNSVTLGECDRDSVTKDGAYFKDGIEYVSGLGLERPRYLTLSDGQVLDRKLA